MTSRREKTELPECNTKESRLLRYGSPGSDTSSAPTLMSKNGFEYFEHGEGEPVIFLHGLFGFAASWNPTLSLLPEGVRGIALTLPVIHPKGLSNVHAITEYVTKFIDTLGLGKAAICGNSLGGQIALDLCVQSPEKVTKLILTGSAGLWEERSNEDRPRVSREFLRGTAESIFFDPEKHVDEEEIEEMYQRLRKRAVVINLIRLVRSTVGYTLKDHLSEIHTPTLLIWGRDDRVTPPLTAHTFHALMPDAQLIFFHECGHAAPVEHPELFAWHVGQFLKG